MNRRDLIGSAVVGATALVAGSTRPADAASQQPASRPRPQRVRMKLGHQHNHSDDWLQLLAALGVSNICSGLPSRKLDENWSVEGLKRLRGQVESYGIQLDCVPLPLSSAYVTQAEFPSIMLGKDPERDRDIDQICQMIENAGKAGIPMLKYNLTLLGVVRTESTLGRGDATYSTFDYGKIDPNLPLTEAGPVSAEEKWARIEYFVKRVVPVAAANRVKLACHPHDPGMPKGKGYRGVHRVLGSVEGLKRFINIVDSPYHGLNFCQGTISEMLEKPGEQIYDVIRYFGERKKIFNVHFRNIEGGFLNFRETFPDNGDVDMLRAIRVYQEYGYDGMVMPDHVPKIKGASSSKEAFAYCYGYIRALLQMLESA